MAQRLDVQYVHFYTDGNAARKTAPVTPLQTMKLPKVKKQKRITLHVDPVAIGGILMAAVMLVLITVGIVDLSKAQKELTVMESYVQELRAENVVLDAEYTNGFDLAEVEKTALALGLVPSEQVKHVTVRVPITPEEKPPNIWEQFYIFLAGLFA